MGHTCRGTINLATANITVEDSCNFVISNGGAQTYHLKASSEVERQRWITALELAKAKAVRMQAESGERAETFMGDIIWKYSTAYEAASMCAKFIILSSSSSSSDDSGDDCPTAPPSAGQGGGGRNSEIQSTLRTMGSKVEDLTTCNDLIVKHGSALQRYPLSWQFDHFRRDYSTERGVTVI